MTLALLLLAAACGPHPTPAGAARAQCATPPSGTGHLEVQVTGLTRAAGSVRVALYDRATWLKEDQSVAHGANAVRETEARVILERVPAGHYAIAVLDDENGDGHMSWGAFGPSEPYGFSRGARGTFGPPSFDDAAFDFDGHALSIEVDVQ